MLEKYLKVLDVLEKYLKVLASIRTIEVQRCGDGATDKTVRAKNRHLDR